MLDKEALLEKFGSQTKVITLESIDGDVKIKKLTISQRQEVNDILFANATIKNSGNPVEIEITNYNKAAKLATSYGIVEPKISLRDIEKLSDGASDFINEVFNAIQEFDEPKK